MHVCTCVSVTRLKHLLNYQLVSDLSIHVHTVLQLHLFIRCLTEKHAFKKNEMFLQKTYRL